MLGGADKSVDVSLFNKGLQLPGKYGVDIYINKERVSSRDVMFSIIKNKEGDEELYPCLSAEDLSLYGVKVENYNLLKRKDKCFDLSIIPGASYSFLFNENRLVLNIPQVSLREREVGIAPQILWSDGIPALLLNYNANFINTKNNQRSAGYNYDNSRYIQLNPGANLGPWRLRNQTGWSKQSGSSSGHWETVYTYLERGINSIKSRLTLGDKSTQPDVFDSTPFRGMMLGSDDNMVPYNMRAFSPVVSGIAKSQARIEVKQNGYTIYSASVPPGPFALTDLTTSGSSGGDFQVSVYESDGTVQNFTVPYQTPAVSVKEGYLAYNIMVGQYRPSDIEVETNRISQATLVYGLPHDLTIYSGMQMAKHFNAMTAGVGYSMGDWGAISLDATASQGKKKFNNNTENGSAWRIRYSKNIVSTNTSFSFGSYQFNSGRYNTLSDVLDTWRSDYGSTNLDRRKSKSYLSLSQSLGQLGYISVNGEQTDYWNKKGQDRSFGISYGVSLLRDISMTLNWNQTKQSRANNPVKGNDKIFSLWLSIPFKQWGNHSNKVNVTYQLVSSSIEHQKQEVGLNGDALNDQLHWGVRQRFSPGSSVSDPNNSDINLLLYNTYGQFGANYNYNPNMQQLGGSVSGGAILHKHGLTIGQPLGDTMALVEAPGAKGVSVIGGRGVKTDFRGYTTDSGLAPYQENVVSIDPITFLDDVEINQTDIKVVPTSGSVVLAKFNPKIGSRALMKLETASNVTIPLGALVTILGVDGTVGIVGLKQQVYLNGLPSKGQLQVNWNSGSCKVNYMIPESKPVNGVYNLTNPCL